MKKIYIFLLSSMMAAVSFGQQRLHQPCQPVNYVSKTDNSPTVLQTPTDTLWGIFPLGSNTASGTATPTIYPATGGGFVSGNNGYGDLDKAQSFTVTSPYTVEGCVFWFGSKKVTSTNPNSKVVSHLYQMDGSGTLSTGTGPAPGTVIATTNTDILVSAIDTTLAGNAGFVYVTFPIPYLATADYAAGITLTTLAAGDTVGLITSTDPQSGMIDQSFDNWSAGGGWYSFLAGANWGLDVDIAIFPIVDMLTAIAESDFVNGIKLYQNYPNPFSSSSVITYELENNAKKVTFFINDLSGKQIKKIELGNVASGKHTLDLTASEFSSGTYFFLMQADRNRLAKKMTIAK